MESVVMDEISKFLCFCLICLKHSEKMLKIILDVLQSYDHCENNAIVIRYTPNGQTLEASTCRRIFPSSLSQKPLGHSLTPPRHSKYTVPVKTLHSCNHGKAIEKQSRKRFETRGGKKNIPPKAFSLYFTAARCLGPATALLYIPVLCFYS